MENNVVKKIVQLLNNVIRMDVVMEIIVVLKILELLLE